MRVSTASCAQLVARGSYEPSEQLLLFLTERPQQSTTVIESTSDSLSTVFKTRSSRHLYLVPDHSLQDAPVPSPSSLPAHSPLITASDRVRLDQWIAKEIDRGLPEHVGRIWAHLIPYLVELSYFVVCPKMTLTANVKQTRRIYEDTKKLRYEGRRRAPLPDLNLSDNIMESAAAALGTLPHSHSDTLVQSLINGEQTSFNLASGAVARSEALHSLDVILTGLWNKRHRNTYTQSQLITQVAKILSYLYWEAGRSPLLDRIALTDTDIGRLERRERESYYSIFSESNISPFLKHLEESVMALHHIRMYCKKRFSRFLMRDPRWGQTFTAQMEAIEAKYRDYLDFS